MKKQIDQTPPDCEALASAIRSTLNASLFRCASSDAKVNAQRNLDGRTHYVDSDTLRYFSSRILAAGDVDRGLLLYLLESTATNADKTARGFRFVVFDIWGTVIERASLSECWKTSEAARRAMWEWLNEFNTAAYYRDELSKRAARLGREAAHMRQIAKTAASVK